MMDYLLYGGIFVSIMLVYVFKTSRQHKENLQSLDDAIAQNLTEPASLHPKIDPEKCLGSGGCVSACPEGDVLGLVHGKATLINPTKCIGHGACKLACPHDAISLVFGTEKRGIDIPEVDKNFQTNVPGIYIAGELGGMGLIRNAVEQGRQAVNEMAKSLRPDEEDMLDVLIVGAGPAGLAASLACKEKNLKFVTLEQDSLGGTVANYPRGKIVMTAPVDLPLVGKMKFTETTKEALMEFWLSIIEKTGLSININERLSDVEVLDDGFKINSEKASYKTQKILLAIGRRGTPRKLGVIGEEKTKVVYKLIDPEQYRGMNVLVVGGGDSALEAAVSISEEPGTEVTLSYRSESFGRAKVKNREKVDLAEQAGKLKVLMSSTVKNIEDDNVTLLQGDQAFCFKNDAVIVCVGGVLPTPFLRQIGINVETKHGTE